MPPRSQRDAAYLNDMREACATIVSRTQRRGLQDLVSDGEFRDSVVLQLILLGEAANHLTKGTKELYPGASWRAIIGLRNLLVHKYWVIDHLKIWEYVTEDIPSLFNALSEKP